MKKILILVLCVSFAFSKQISAYLFGDFMPPNIVKKKLSSKGFQTIGEYNAMGDKNYHIIVYTSYIMKDMALKKDREFAAVGKVLIDYKKGRVVLTNPNYFLRAFLQNDLDEDRLSNISQKLDSAFSKHLQHSKMGLSKGDIKGYHFMFAMPYYEDMIEVAKGRNLANKLKNNAKDKIAFELNFSNGDQLFGIYMDGENGEKSYISTLHEQEHCAFLPYMVLVTKDKAKILHPKYYLAISLPSLSLGQFMKISSTPSHIEDYFKDLFK